MLANESPNRQLVSTRTGESCQPTRIYFQVFKPKTVLGAFKKLRCMEYDRDGDRWIWLFDHEAKRLRLPYKYNQVPKQYRPLILGDFRWQGEDELVVDLRSIQRAAEALKFFSKRFNKRTAIPTKVRVVNHFFDRNTLASDADLAPPYHRYFEDRDDIYIPDLAAEDRAYAAVAEADYPDEESKEEALADFFEKQNSHPLPELEEIPLRKDRDLSEEVERLGMLLLLNYVQAQHHWEGNPNYTRSNALAEMLLGLAGDDAMPEIVDEEAEDPLTLHQPGLIESRLTPEDPDS